MVEPLLARLICTAAKLDANSVHVRSSASVQRLRSVKNALNYLARVDEIVRAAPMQGIALVHRVCAVECFAVALGAARAVQDDPGRHSAARRAGVSGRQKSDERKGWAGNDRWGHVDILSSTGQHCRMPRQSDKTRNVIQVTTDVSEYVENELAEQTGPDLVGGPAVGQPLDAATQAVRIGRQTSPVVHGGPRRVRRVAGTPNDEPITE